jgi:hypothetical protein
MRQSWELYDKLVTADGETLRDRNIERSKRDYQSSSADSLSRKTVEINGEERDVLIESGSTLHIKTMTSMPNEQFFAGDYVLWENVYWLVSDMDRECAVYYRGTIRECNRLLRWQDDDGNIIERWCATDEKASYTQGLTYNSVIDRVKTVYTLFLPLDSDTMKIRRYHRFIMDVDLEDPDTYVVTNRNVISAVYDPDLVHGVIRLVLSQDERSQDNDNLNLQIADYTKPKEIIKGANCEIKYDGKDPNIKAGGSHKVYTAVFYDASGAEITGVTPHWDITFMSDQEQYFEYEIVDNTLSIKAKNEPSIIHSQVRIALSADGVASDCILFAKVVYVL